jgi:hypothetical protein
MEIEEGEMHDGVRSYRDVDPLLRRGIDEATLSLINHNSRNSFVIVNQIRII